MNTHDLLHQLSDELIEIKTVIEASDKNVHELYKKHIALLAKCEERLKIIENTVDKEVIDKVEYQHNTDHGCWP